MSRHRLPALLLLPVLLAGVGCEATVATKRSEDFRPEVPLRIAVLPFVNRAAGDDVVGTPLTAGIDEVPILSEEDLSPENAGLVVRYSFLQELQRSNHFVADPYLTDSLLGAHDMADDLEAIYTDEKTRLANTPALGDALGADPILFGIVTQYDREYYGVESVVRVGLYLELRDAASGHLLYGGEVRDYEAAGVSDLPIAIDPIGVAESTIIESIRGLANTRFLKVVQSVSRYFVEDMTGVTLAERAETPPPTIRFVAHDGREVLEPGDRLTVVALGDPKCLATFRVGDAHREVPMSETAPGSYRASLIVSSGHRWSGDSVTVTLLNAAGRRSLMRVSSPALRTSTAGTK